MEWIKTSERKPEINQRVIVHDGLLSGTAVYKGFHRYLNPSEWEWWGGASPPAHWMPLPSPPGEGQEAEREARAALIASLTEINAHTFVDVINKYHISMGDIKRMIEKYM